MISFKDIIVNKIKNSDKAREFLSDKIKFMFKEHSGMSKDQKLKELDQILSKIILPHVEVIENNYQSKIEFLSLMARRLFRSLFKLDIKKEGDVDIRNDRDFLANKRIECAGDMLSLLFEDLFKRFNSDVKKEMDRFL